MYKIIRQSTKKIVFFAFCIGILCTAQVTAGTGIAGTGTCSEGCEDYSRVAPN